MMVRIQLEIPEEERARFAGQAAREGKTLDAWLIAAAKQRLSTPPSEPEPAEASEPAPEAHEAPAVDVGQSILDMFDELHRSMPEGALDDWPTDLSANLKHYLYGWPKDTER